MRPRTLGSWTLLFSACVCTRKGDKVRGKFLLEDGTVFTFLRNYGAVGNVQSCDESVLQPGNRKTKEDLFESNESFDADGCQKRYRLCSPIRRAERLDRDSDELAGKTLPLRPLATAKRADKGIEHTLSTLPRISNDLGKKETVVWQCATSCSDDVCEDVKVDEHFNGGLTSNSAKADDIRPTVASKTHTIKRNILLDALSKAAISEDSTSLNFGSNPSKDDHTNTLDTAANISKVAKKPNPYAGKHNTQNAFGNVTMDADAYSQVAGLHATPQPMRRASKADNPFASESVNAVKDQTWACTWASAFIDDTSFATDNAAKIAIARLERILGTTANGAKMARALAALHFAANEKHTEGAATLLAHSSEIGAMQGYAASVAMRGANTVKSVFSTPECDAADGPLAYVRFALAAIALRWWVAIGAVVAGVPPAQAAFTVTDIDKAPVEIELGQLVDALVALVSEHSAIPGTSAGLLFGKNAVDHLELALAMHPLTMERGVVTRAVFAEVYVLALSMPLGVPTNAPAVVDVIAAACGVETEDARSLLATGLPPTALSWPTIAQTAMLVRVARWWTRAVRLVIENDYKERPSDNGSSKRTLRAMRWPLLKDVVESLLANNYETDDVLPAPAQGESPSVRARAIVRSRRVAVVGSPLSVDFAHLALSLQAYIVLRVHARSGHVPAVFPSVNDDLDDDLGVNLITTMYSADALRDIERRRKLYFEPVEAMRALHDAAISRLEQDQAAVLAAVSSEERMLLVSCDRAFESKLSFSSVDERKRRLSPMNASSQSTKSRAFLSPILQNSSTTLDLCSRSLDTSQRPPSVLEPLSRSSESLKWQTSARDRLSRTNSGLFDMEARTESRSAGHVRAIAGLRTDAAGIAEARLVLALAQIRAHLYAHAMYTVADMAVRSGACDGSKSSAFYDLCQVHAVSGGRFVNFVDELALFSLWRTIPTAWNPEALVQSAFDSRPCSISKKQTPATPSDDILQPGEAPLVYVGSATKGKAVAIGFRDLVRVLVSGASPRSTADSPSQWVHFSASIRAALQWRRDVDAVRPASSKEDVSKAPDVRLVDLSALASYDPAPSEAILADLAACRLETASAALVSRLNRTFQRPAGSTGVGLLDVIVSLFPSLHKNNSLVDSSFFTVVPPTVFEERSSHSPGTHVTNGAHTLHDACVSPRFVRRLVLFAAVSVPEPSRARVSAYPYVAACTRPSAASDLSTAHATNAALRGASKTLSPVMHGMNEGSVSSALMVSETGRSLVPSPISLPLSHGPMCAPLAELEAAGRAHGIDVFPPVGRTPLSAEGDEYSVEAAQYVMLCHGVWRELLAIEADHRPGIGDAAAARDAMVAYVSGRAVGLHIWGEGAAVWSRVLSALFGRGALGNCPRYLPSFATFVAVGLALLARAAVSARVSAGRRLGGVFGTLGRDRPGVCVDAPANMFGALLFLEARGATSAALYGEILSREASDYVPARRETVAVVPEKTVKVCGAQATLAVSPETVETLEPAYASRTAVVNVLARWDVPNHVLLRVAMNLPEAATVTDVAAAIERAAGV